MTVSEERDELQRMLRKVCKAAQSLPKDVQAWWADEQVAMEREAAQIDARKVAKAADIIARIADLQQQLEQLS